MQNKDAHNATPMNHLSDFQTVQQHKGLRRRRRPSPEQGRALEVLGHAVEYLIDEGLLTGETINVDVTEAVHLLSAASRSVYLDCSDLAPAARSSALVRWKWLPQASHLLPVFRDARRRDEV